MLLLNIRKPYMGTLSHLTLSDIERSKLRCRIWSEIDTCIVRYCLRVNPDLNWFSLQLWVLIQVCRKLSMSAQLQLPSRVPRSLDLLFLLDPFMYFALNVFVHSVQWCFFVDLHFTDFRLFQVSRLRRCSMHSIWRICSICSNPQSKKMAHIWWVIGFSSNNTNKMIKILCHLWCRIFST